MTRQLIAVLKDNDDLNLTGCIAAIAVMVVYAIGAAILIYTAVNYILLQ